MRRVVQALGLMTLGAVLVCTARWLHTYLYPEVIYPREDQIARILLSYVPVDATEAASGAMAVPEKAGVVVCVVRQPHARDAKDWEFVRSVSYFRALARPWDLRGWLLDRRWPISAVSRYAKGVVFSVSALKGACEWKFNERKATNLFPKDVSLEFFSDCATVPSSEKRMVVKLVAVSPAIRNPYRTYKETRSAFGFFMAIERLYPQGKSERFVCYYQSYVLSQELVEISDHWRLFKKAIPEKYWASDFGAWKSVSEEASEDKWWTEMVFPPPYGN